MVIVSCKSAETTKTHIINFSEAIDNIGLINLSEVAKSIRYVPLETREEALIGEYVNISYDGNYIVAADILTGIIKVFDTEGRLIRVIDRVGRGPEEYLPVIVNLSFFNGNIIVMTSREIVEYDISGNYIRRIATPAVEGYRVGNPTIIGENQYTAAIFDITLNNEYCAVVYDSMLNINQRIATPGNTKSQRLHGGGIGSAQIIKAFPAKTFQYGERSLLFYPESEEILYVNKTHAIDTAFIIEYGGYRVPDGVITLDLLNNGRYISLASFVESEDFLFMDMNTMATINGIRRSYSLYDKKTGKSSILYDEAENKTGFKDNIVGGPEFWPKSVFGKKTLLSDISALSLIEFAENNTVSKDLEKIVSAMDENSNPVIAIVELK